MNIYNFRCILRNKYLRLVSASVNVLVPLLFHKMKLHFDLHRKGRILIDVCGMTLCNTNRSGS